MTPSEERELAEAVARVRALGCGTPRLGVVLGSGLGAFADSLSGVEKTPFASIPHFPRPLVSGHSGNLCLGRLGSLDVACLQGRIHAYEGHAVGHLVLGVRLLAALGCGIVLLTNAAGGIRDELGAGSWMLVVDHLNLTGKNPLVGPVGSHGARFPDMTEAYDVGLRVLAREAATELKVDLKEGVYAGLLGPSYETPAEVRMLRVLGADAVGMSTVLETIALRQLGVRVGAISVITNRAAGLAGRPLDHREVERTAEATSGLFVELLGRWAMLAGLE